MDEFSIYVLGDADSYFFVFNSIAALIQSNYIEFAIAMALMVATIRSGLAFSKADPKTGVYSIMLMIGLFSAALYPTTTAHIIDVRQQGQNKTYTKIDNLPFALTFLASSVSTVLVPVAEITEVAFSNTENSATKVGLGKQPEMISNFMKVSNFINQESANYPLSFFKNAFKIYTKECAMSTSHIPDVGLDYFIKPSQDIVDHINPITLGIPSSAYTNTTFSDGTVTIQKCNDLYNYIVDKRASIENLIEKKFSEINSDIDYEAHKEEIAKGLYEAGIRVGDITSTLGTYSENLKISMLNYALSQTLEETITDYKYDLPGISGDLIDYSVNKSSYQMQTDGLGSWAWTNKMAPLVIHYMLIFSYALFLFVIPVAMGMGFENSKKMLINYSMGIIAIHLGYLSSTVANSIALYYMEKSATNLIFELGNNLMAMNSIPAFNAYASEMAAISGILLISSYFLGTGIILKGETAAMQGIMNTIGSRFKNDMLSAAQDMSSKNAYDEVDQKAKTDARRFLGQNGFKAPIGVDEVSYANEIKRGLETMGGGYGFASASQGSSSFESDYMSGVANKSAAAAVGTATVGSRVSTTESIDSGIATGNLEAGKMSGLASSLKQIGGNALFDASRTGTIAQNKDQVANASALSSKFGKDLDGTLNGLSYDEMASAESNSKLAGRVGGSKGYLNLGKDAFDKTAENAEYMTESKARSTQATISGKGGLRNAVALDETGAEIKAGTDKGSIEQKAQMLEEAMGKGVAKGAKSLSEAMASIAGVSSATQFGKEIGFANKLTSENAQSLYDQLLGTKDANGNNLFNKSDLADMYNSKGDLKSGAELASWISGKQAGHLSGMHGLAIGDKTVGLALGEHDVRVASTDASTKVDTSSTKKAGISSSIDNSESYKEGLFGQFGSAGALAMELAGGNKDLATKIMQDGEMANFLASKQGVLMGTSGALNRLRHEFNEKFGTDFGEEHSAMGTIMDAAAIGGTFYAGRKLTQPFLGGKTKLDNAPNTNNATSIPTDNINPESTNNSLRNYGNAEAHNESITKNNIDGNSSLMGKGGLYGFAAAIGHQLAMNNGDFGATMTAIGQEVGSTWKQFKNDVSSHGIFQATGNQIGDAIIGESARMQVTNAFSQGNTAQAFGITAGGIADNVTGLVGGVANMGVSGFQAITSDASYAQSFNQNAQSWAGGTDLAGTIASSNISSPTANALFSGGNTTIDNPVVSNIERGISQDAHYAQSSKEANIELIDQMTVLADALKDNTNKERS